MHKSLTMFGLAGAAMMIAQTPALAKAQEEEPEAAAPAKNTDARLAGLTPDQQTAFKTWPAETQSYYLSLNAERQKIFWALSDSDKVALSRMPEQQRESTWAQIEARTAPPKA